MSAAFLEIQSKLTSLDLRRLMGFPPLQVAGELTRLTHLGLRSFQIYGSQLHKHFQSLASLSLVNCMVAETDIFVSFLSRIKKLLMENNLDCRRPKLGFIPLIDTVFPELEFLTIDIDFIKGAMEPDKPLRKLKTLCLTGDFKNFCLQSGITYAWRNFFHR
ncbi:MAG: hypothetical protein MJA83_09050 [Gammaproteobacteria bacterium]|nr:hypothetical protein [Gammaproteobacteria bacterium]